MLPLPTDSASGTGLGPPSPYPPQTPGPGHCPTDRRTCPTAQARLVPAAHSSHLGCSSAWGQLLALVLLWVSMWESAVPRPWGVSREATSALTLTLSALRLGWDAGTCE